MKQATRESLRWRSVAELVEHAKSPVSPEEIERRRRAGLGIRTFRETRGTIDLNSEDLLHEEEDAE